MAAWPSGDRWERRLARRLIKEDVSQMPRGPSDSEGAHVSMEKMESQDSLLLKQEALVDEQVF